MQYSLSDLRDHLADLDASVSARQARVVDAEVALAEARTALAQDQALRDGAERFLEGLARYEAAHPVRLEPASSSAEITPIAAAPTQPETIVVAPVRAATGQTAEVEAVLRDKPEGLHVSQIHAILFEKGIDFDREQVRSAVTYLNRRDKIEQLSRGVWRIKVIAPELPRDLTEVRPLALAPTPISAESGAG